MICRTLAFQNIPLYEYEEAFLAAIKFKRWGILEKLGVFHLKPSQLLKDFLRSKLLMGETDYLINVTKYVEFSLDILQLIDCLEKEKWEHVVMEILPKTRCNPMKTTIIADGRVSYHVI